MRKRKKRPMSEIVEEKPPEPTPEEIKTREDVKNRISFRIYREPDAQEVKIYLRAPLLADIVRKMTPGNYAIADFDPVFKPILLPVEKNKTLAVTRPAIGRITKNFVSAGDWSWDNPRAILLANPDALEAGFTLTFKPEQPMVAETMRAWGDKLVRGIKDIVANAKPFTMHWTLDETPAK